MWGKRKKVENNVNKCVNIKGAIQGVWTRRQIQLIRPALPYDYKCFADGTPLYKKYSAQIIVYCIRQIFLIQWSTVCKALYLPSIPYSLVSYIIKSYYNFFPYIYYISYSIQFKIKNFMLFMVKIRFVLFLFEFGRNIPTTSILANMLSFRKYFTCNKFKCILLFLRL